LESWDNGSEGTDTQLGLQDQPKSQVSRGDTEKDELKAGIEVSAETSFFGTCKLKHQVCWIIQKRVKSVKEKAETALEVLHHRKC